MLMLMVVTIAALVLKLLPLHVLSSRAGVGRPLGREKPFVLGLENAQVVACSLGRGLGSSTIPRRRGKSLGQ